jgi:protein SCO1/2
MILFLLACTRAPNVAHATVLDPPVAVPDFVLTDRHGQLARLSDTRGEPVLLFFGFTRCTSICPMVMQKVRDAPAQVVFVTVDPSDDPARLDAWLPPSAIGLTGDDDALAQVRTAYGAFAEGSGTEIEHSGQVFGIDRAGQLRVLFDPDASADDIATGIARM